MQQERSSVYNTCTTKKSLCVFKVEEQDPRETLALPICQLWGCRGLPTPPEMGVNTVAKRGELVLGDGVKSCTPPCAQGPRDPGQTSGVEAK